MLCSGAFLMWCWLLRTTALDQTHLEVFLQACKVKTDSLLVKVSVALDLKARITENGCVVAPRWHREVNGLGWLIVSRQESTSDSQSTSARDRLGDCNLRIV
jgi:hypothetical protein